MYLLLLCPQLEKVDNFGGEFCEIYTPCSPSPCNNGTCTEVELYDISIYGEDAYHESADTLSYTCSCFDNYYGDHCEEYFVCEPGFREIVWVVDGSASVGEENYLKQIAFIKAMTRALLLSEDTTRAAFIQYTVGDGDSITEFYFQHDIDTFDSLVDSVVYAKGFTLTGAAISHAHNDVIKNHARPGADVSMIVVTDGESFDQVLGPSNTARGDGVDMYAVGIQNYNLEQLEDIAIRFSSVGKCKHQVVISFESVITK